MKKSYTQPEIKVLKFNVVNQLMVSKTEPDIVSQIETQDPGPQGPREPSP